MPPARHGSPPDASGRGQRPWVSALSRGAADHEVAEHRGPVGVVDRDAAVRTGQPLLEGDGLARRGGRGLVLQLRPLHVADLAPGRVGPDQIGRVPRRRRLQTGAVRLPLRVLRPGGRGPVAGRGRPGGERTVVHAGRLEGVDGLVAVPGVRLRHAVAVVRALSAALAERRDAQAVGGAAGVGVPVRGAERAALVEARQRPEVPGGDVAAAVLGGGGRRVESRTVGDGRAVLVLDALDRAVVAPRAVRVGGRLRCEGGQHTHRQQTDQSGPGARSSYGSQSSPNGAWCGSGDPRGLKGELGRNARQHRFSAN